MHTPRKINNVRNEFTPWLTSSIRDIITRRDTMKKASTKNPSIWPAYKRLRNQCTNSIWKTIQDYHQRLVEETRNDHKTMWKTINRVLERDSACKSISSRNVNGKVVTENGKLAEALNVHFATVGPKLAENITPMQCDNPLKYIESKDSATSLKTSH